MGPIYAMAMPKAARVRIEVESELVTSDKPARVLVYEDNVLVAEVEASITMEQGAGFAWYHCVKLKKK